MTARGRTSQAKYGTGTAVDLTDLDLLEAIARSEAEFGLRAVTWVARREDAAEEVPASPHGSSICRFDGTPLIQH